MSLPANWSSGAASLKSRMRVTALPFVLAGMAASFLITATIFRQSTRMWLPKDSTLAGAPHANGPALFLLIQGGYIIGFVLLLLPKSWARSMAMGIVVATAMAQAAVQVLEALGMTVEGLWGFKVETQWMKGVYPLLLLSLGLQILLTLATIVWIATEKEKNFLFASCGFVLGIGLLHQQLAVQKKAWNSFQQFVTEKRAEDKAAHEMVQAIAWCGIEMHSRSPEGEYPAALEHMQQGANCVKPWSFEGKPDYRFSYDLQYDANVKKESFFVKAIAATDATVSLQSYGSDESGVLLVLANAYPGWNRIADSSPAGYAEGLQNCLQHYAADHKETGFPRELGEAKSCALAVAGAKQAKTNTFVFQNYLLTYTPASTSPPVNSYTMSIRCEAYGESCVRNLYVDPQNVTGTSENREAMADDPASLPCEKRSAAVLGSCKN